MTFKRRILLFGIGVSLVVGLGVSVVIMSLLGLRDQFDRLMSRQVAAKVQTVVIGREVNFVSRLTRNIMLGSSIEKDLNSLDDTIAKIEKAFTTLESTAATPEDQALITKAREATLAFVKDGRERMLGLRDVPSERRPAAFKEYETFATPLAMKSRESFDGIIKHADREFEEGSGALGREIKSSLWMVLVGGIAAILSTILAFYYLLRAILRPIHVVAHDLRTIRETWNLTRRLEASSVNEMGEIAREANTFLQALFEVIRTVNENSARVASGATELSATANELAKTSHEIARFSETQRQTSERTAAAMTQFSASIQEVAKHVQSSNTRTETMAHAAEEGAHQGEATVHAMESIQEKTTQMVQAVRVIQDLARQTNLLSLNAAIEAAKAGAQGKGFAVVAEEVRKLAEHSSQAAKQIGDLISQTEEAIGEGVRTVSATEGTIRTILENIQVVVSASREIGSATEEQGKTSAEVARQVEETSVSIERSAAASTELSQTVEEVNRTAEHLAGIADGLATTLAKFRTT
jgi:methyl-accepting chemotaxis protein